MMAPECSCYATPGPPNASGGYDPKFLGRPQMHPLPRLSSLTPPAGSTWDQSLYLAATELARRFGYGAEPVPMEAMAFRWRGLSLSDRARYRE